MRAPVRPQKDVIMKMTKYLVIAVLAAGATACSMNSSTRPKTAVATTAASTTTSQPSPAVLSRQVLAIIDNGETAIKKAETISNDNSQEYTAISAACDTIARQLQALTYPADAQADAKTFVAILEKESKDLTQAAPSADVDASTLQIIINDQNTEKADSNALRHDLGLPPATV